MNNEILEIRRALYELELSNKNFSKSVEIVDNIIKLLDELEKVVV